MLRHTVTPLLVLALTTASSAQTRWPDPVANDVLPYQTAGLTHGPTLGRPAADGVAVWVRTDQPREFRVRYATQIPITDKSDFVAGRTDADRDNTGVVTLHGLKPDTRYFYAVELDGRLADLRIDFTDPWPAFRTLPDESVYVDENYNPTGRFNICFSVGCCACQDPIRSGGHYGSTPAFGTLLSRFGDEIQFHVMNGDTIYEEERDGTLEGLRRNYRLYWHRGRNFSRLIRNVPALYTYDDHEIGWDIHGAGEIGLGKGKHLMRDYGLKAWNENVGWADPVNPHNGNIVFGTATLKAGSDRLHDESANFTSLKLSQVSTLHVGPYPGTAQGAPQPKSPRNAGVYRVDEILDQHTLRVSPAPSANETVDYSIGAHHYRDWKFGNCHYFLLDTRGERTRPNLNDVHDQTRFALGDAQKNWLLQGAAHTDADFIFIISPDPWVIYHSAYHVAPERGHDPKGDGMASFVHEREQVLTALDQLDKPVMIFTGDVHNSLSVQITDNVREFMVGPLGSTAHPVGTAGGMPFGGPWNSQGRNVKIRWIAGFPDNVHYERLRSTFFAVVRVNNMFRTARPEGSGYQYVAYDEPQVVVTWYDGYTGRQVYAESVSRLDFQ